MPDRVSLPPFLLDAARDRRARFVAREDDLAVVLTQYYAGLLGGYRTELQTYFNQFTTLSPNPAAEPVWDFIAANRERVPERLADDFAQVISDAEAGAADVLDDALVESYDDGRDEALYLFALLGLDLSDLPDGADPETIAAELMQDGFEGEGWASRLTEWTTTYADKFRTGLKGAMVVGASLAATTGLYDRLGSQLVGRVVGLGQNELFRADAAGALTVMSPFVESGEIVEVWVTRGDKLVCPICQALHLTVTTLRPVDNSHTNCRCSKVPFTDLTDRERADVVDFATFKQGLH